MEHRFLGAPLLRHEEMEVVDKLADVDLLVGREHNLVGPEQMRFVLVQFLSVVGKSTVER